METWIDTVKTVLGQLLFLAPEEPHFNTLLLVGAGSIMLFGKLIASYVVGSKRGFMLVFLGMVLSFVVVVAGLSAYDIYLVEKIASETFQVALKTALGIILFSLVGVYLVKVFLDVSWGMSLAALILTFALSLGCIYLTSQGIDSVAGGFQAVEEKNKDLEN